MIKNLRVKNLRVKCILGCALALIIRIDLMDFESLDFTYFLNPWYGFIAENGHFLALKHDFSNYNPLYLYFLAAWSLLFPKLSSLYVVKSISILFDFIAASLTYCIIQLKYPYNYFPSLASLCLLLAPTVILNGAYWGQCDITYTSSLLGFLYFLLVQQFSLALIAFTLALAFKLQAIFLAPLLAILLIRGVMPGSRLVLIPVTYGLTLLPAHLVGRPWSELLTIYHQQFNTYRSLTLNAPTLYQWLPDRPYTTFVILGLSWTALLTLGLLIFTYKKIKAFTPELIITLALLSSILLPFFLPKMHDRYFFGADVISIIFAFYQPKYWWISPAILAISLASYAPYLLQQEIIPLKFLALGLALILWQLFRVLAQTIDEQHVTDQTLPSA